MSERLFKLILIFAIQVFGLHYIRVFYKFWTFHIMNHYCGSLYHIQTMIINNMFHSIDTIDVYYSKGTYVHMYVPPASFMYVHIYHHIYSYILLRTVQLRGNVALACTISLSGRMHSTVCIELCSTLEHHLIL